MQIWRFQEISTDRTAEKFISRDRDHHLVQGLFCRLITGLIVRFVTAMVVGFCGTRESCLVAGHGRGAGPGDLGRLQAFCGRPAHEPDQLVRGGYLGMADDQP